MTEPLTPIDLDLRGFGFMPLEVLRLRDSDLAALATGNEFRAAVLLWCAAWHQVPAASLPNDDRLLAKLAGFGRDLKGWNAVRAGALRGFILCTDGRLYHPVVADIAIESGSKKRLQISKTMKATEARIRKAKERREANLDVHRDSDRNVSNDVDRDGPHNEVQGIGEEKNGEDRTMNEADKSDAQASLATDVVVSTPLDRKVRRRSIIAADFTLTDAERQYAIDRGWSHSFIEQQLEKFRNHHLAKGSTMADWNAAWRKWVSNGYDFARGGMSSGKVGIPSRVDSAIEGMMSDLSPADFASIARRVFDG